MNHFESKPMKQRRPKQKIEKSNEEFKEHERIIMDKRIAEINNVITKKCHTLWNQYLYLKKKPHTLQFNFVYHGFENYLKKCDDYKAEQHKDNKQKWWNNQKASEMSQQFLPSVLNSTDHMAQYIGKQMEGNLQIEFTNYVTFELLETAITSVFSTQRSGSNEVFLRTSFQYAKAGLRKKLVSYFGDGELREYDTKSRKKKDLWQRLIKEKKERLLEIFLHKKSVYSQDSKVGIISDIISDNNNKNNNNNTAAAAAASAAQFRLYHDSKQATFGYDENGNDDSTMYINPPPSLLNTVGDYNGYDVNNGYCCYNNSNVNVMDGLNGTLPFPQPLLMDITLTYPNNQSANSENHNNLNNLNNGYHGGAQQQQATLPPPVCMATHVPTKTAVYDSRHSMSANQLTMNTNPHTMMMRDATNNCYNIATQCRQCLEYMTKISELLKVNQAINDDCAQLKQVNIKYEAERDHWKSQYQQLFKQYQNLLRQNNDLQQEKHEEKHQEYGDMDRDLSIKTNEDDTEGDDDDDDDDDDHDDDEEESSLKRTPFSNEMSVSSKTGANNLMHNGIQQIPLDDLAKTPFAQFLNDSNSITPYADGINPFPFPSNSINTNNNDTKDDDDDDDDDQVMNTNREETKSQNRDDNKSEMSASIFSHNINQNGSASSAGSAAQPTSNKCTVSIAAPSVMSICSNNDHRKQYFNDSSSSTHLMSAFNSQFNSDHIHSMVQ